MTNGKVKRSRRDTACRVRNIRDVSTFALADTACRVPTDCHFHLYSVICYPCTPLFVLPEDVNLSP